MCRVDRRGTQIRMRRARTTRFCFWGCMTDDLIPDQFHVLIVDDDEAFLNVTEALLKAIGVKSVTKATNGREAFGFLKQSPRVVDCVLCDYSMTPGTGLELLQAIRTGM